METWLLTEMEEVQGLNENDGMAISIREEWKQLFQNIHIWNLLVHRQIAALCFYAPQKRLTQRTILE